jgi:DNA-binding NtrC family response regulator
MPQSQNNNGVNPVQVLIVDDDFTTRGLLSDVLVTNGYQVCVAPRAADVRAFFGAIEPGVVLLDWKLPDGDGIALIPEIKSHWPNTNVVMISGYATPDVTTRAANNGAFKFLVKPFYTEELLQAVKEAYGHKDS